MASYIKYLHFEKFGLDIFLFLKCEEGYSRDGPWPATPSLLLQVCTDHFFSRYLLPQDPTTLSIIRSPVTNTQWPCQKKILPNRDPVKAPASLNQGPLEQKWLSVLGRREKIFWQTTNRQQENVCLFSGLEKPGTLCPGYRTSTHTHMHVHAHTHTRMHVHAHTHMHACTCTHTHRERF